MTLVACKKLVQVSSPATDLNAGNVFQNDGTAIAALDGIYEQVNTNTFSNAVPGIVSTSFWPALSADELTLYSGVNNASMIEYYTNSLKTSVNQTDFWTGIYPVIFSCNAAIQGLSASSTGLTPVIQQQLLGEAFFTRALHYFYLVNFYGDVPLVLTTNYKTNSALPRSPANDVWIQIISDLQSAESDLSANFLDGTILNTTTERTRPTKWAAAALLARAYLYTQKWDSAVVQSSLVINNSSLFSLDSLDQVFEMNSTEAIWQLEPVLPGYNSIDARTFVLSSSGPNNSNNPVYLSTTLVNAFEIGDQRRIVWVDSVTIPVNGNNTTYYFPYKYTVSAAGSTISEYEMVLRLGEQYLIRAEAEAELNSLTTAASDLNAIRNRAGLSNTTAANQTDLLSAILHERQVELFTEWGHRWLDLKRTGAVDSVMTVQCPLKGGTWSDNAKLYPVPASEIQEDSKLVQNQGY